MTPEQKRVEIEKVCGDQETAQKVFQIIKQEGRASLSLVQRRLRLGYSTTKRIFDALEEMEIIGPDPITMDRTILIHPDAFLLTLPEREGV